MLNLLEKENPLELNNSEMVFSNEKYEIIIDLIKEFRAKTSDKHLHNILHNIFDEAEGELIKFKGLSPNAALQLFIHESGIKSE